MKIGIITFWYNEEELAPYFLKHYGYVDDIFVYLDTDTDDNTRSICEAHSNVTIRGMSYPQGFDAETKTHRINQVVRGFKYGWVYSVDADELIQQPKQYKSAAEFLLKQERLGYNLVIAQMYQVYRHSTDKDLDISKPVLAQRCYGDPNLSTVFNRCYIKPIVVRPRVGITWGPGCHNYAVNKKIRVAKEQFFGAHWKMADASFAIKRRLQKKQRHSERQIAKKRGWQDTRATEKSISEELKRHRHDPNVLGFLLPAGR